MSDFTRKYIMITTTILLIIVCASICWLFKEIRIFMVTFAYLSGVANGMIIIGITNKEE